jgi:hypothetical protein
MSEIISFAIKSLLDGKRFWRRPAHRAGRRRSAGLAPPAAFGGGGRPPTGGGSPTKYHRLAFKNSLHRIGIRLAKAKLTFFTLF